jgi:hypothetical protein
MNSSSEKPMPAERKLLVLEATPEQVAAIQRILSQELPTGRGGETRSAPDEEYVFRRTHRVWEVIFGGGRPFHLEDTLGARYLDYLLHHPNEPISAFELEVAVQPEKGEARLRNSVQPESDARARREYQQALRRLEGERQRSQAAGDRKEVARLEGEMAALETALQGDHAPDTGERAYDNVRKALRRVTQQLRKGGPAEKAFAEHLRTHLRIGFECLHSEPEGRIWD